MNIPPNIFKAYDIRGLYPEEINEENIAPIVKAFYTFLLQDKKFSEPLTIVLGRDMRVSSPSLYQVARKTLLGLGANVLDFDLLSTPSFYFAVFKYKADGGMQISASHNPKQYNGLKVVKLGEKGLIKIGKDTGMEDIKRLSLEIDEIVLDKKGVLKKISSLKLLQEEVENALQIIGNPKLKPLKIVADPANAMGITYLGALFEKIPGKLIKMNFKLDGTFPSHQPDPLQKETLVDLQKRVVKEKADLGIATDGDGDRCFFIDEKGDIISPSIITALVAKELLQENQGAKILFDIRYIYTPEFNVRAHGGIPVITRVGHAFITEQMAKHDGLFAGESSGHYFFSATGNAESQLPVILTVLKILSRENKKMSEIVRDIRKSFESGEINFTAPNASEVMVAVQEKYKEGKLTTLDGIAMAFDKWRFSLRSSNTEPLLRLNVEELEEGFSELESNGLGQKKKELVSFIEELSKS